MPVTRPSAHAQHDALLIAKLAANDTTPSELVQANALIADCPDCAELYRDLQALQVATRALPAPVRGRDFRLTPADAARLRPSRRLGWPGSAWRAGLEWLAGPRFAFTQQLGVGLAALGIAGLLFATVPGFLGANTITTILSTTGRPIGQSDTSMAAPTPAATIKSGAAGAPAPTAAGGTSATSESTAVDQSAAPSAAGAAVPQPAPTAISLFGPSAAPAAAPTAPPNAASTAAQNAAPTAAPTAAPSAAPTAPPTAAPEATVARVAQGAAPTGRGPSGSEQGGGLSPFLFASIVLFLVGLGLLLARRMAVALTDR